MPPDGKWGDPGENGTWTGLMGLLHTRVISFFRTPPLPPPPPSYHYLSHLLLSVLLLFQKKNAMG